MTAYIVRRILLALFTAWVISVLAWVVIELPPGDNVKHFLDRQMQMGTAVDLQVADEVRRHFGLDKPQYVRYAIWLGRLLRGDLGLAISEPGEQYLAAVPVKSLVSNRIWTTIVLTGFTILVTWTFAIPIGIYSAIRQHSVGDYLFTFVGFAGLAVPDFLLGLVLMYVALAYFGQSVGGLFSPQYQDAPMSIAKLRDLLAHLWIPAVVLGTAGTAGLIRIMRNNLLDELAKPYVVTARAKGLSSWRVHPQVPGAGRRQPAGEHGRLPAAGAGQRQRDRLGGAGPAHAGPGLPVRDPGRGRPHGGIHRPAARHPDRRRHPDIRHPPRRRRPQDQVHGLMPLCRGGFETRPPMPLSINTPALAPDRLTVIRFAPSKAGLPAYCGLPPWGGFFMEWLK